VCSSDLVHRQDVLGLVRRRLDLLPQLGDNFVAKLRQKIEPAPHEPEHILTVHGAGYKFVG